MIRTFEEQKEGFGPQVNVMSCAAWFHAAQISFIFFSRLVLRPSAFLFLFELILGNIPNRTIYLLHANSFAAGIRRETSFPNKVLNDIKTGTVPGIAKAPNIEIMRQLATIEFVDACGSRNTWLLASIGMHRYIWRWLDPTFALSSYVY